MKRRTTTLSLSKRFLCIVCILIVMLSFVQNVQNTVKEVVVELNELQEADATFEDWCVARLKKAFGEVVAPRNILEWSATPSILDTYLHKLIQKQGTFQKEKMRECLFDITEELLQLEIAQAIGDTDPYMDVRDDMISIAMAQLGNRYVSAGTTLENGTDCSGFTRIIYGMFGYSIGKVANDQYHNAVMIAYQDLKPGDLVFYGSGEHASHVAMYVGDGMIVHSANSRRGVVVDQMSYMHNVLGYGRFM